MSAHCAILPTDGGYVSQKIANRSAADDLGSADVSVKAEVTDGFATPHRASDPSLDVERPNVAEGRVRRGDVRGMLLRCMDVLVSHGVEARGIVPRPEDERDELNVWSYFPQFTLWAAFNTNILTFSEGVIGPALFELDLKTCVLCIVFFTAISCIPPAYLTTNGPNLGMRQMVQARFALGFVPALLFGLVNCIVAVGFLSLTVILGGQCLSLASGSSMSWTVGIVVVAIISLLLSFIGLRALHILSLTSFPIILILYVVLVGVTGPNLRYAASDAAKAVTDVTASGVLGYGASLIGFTVSYSSLASDFTTTLPPHTPRLTLFLCVFFGLFIPITVIQIFGAAAQLAAFSIPAWEEASLIGTPDLLFAMTGEGKAAKFVMVLFCFSVAANTAPTIYSAGLSGQVAIPWLVRVPRYFLAVIVSAIYLPVAIVGVDHFYTALLNFLSVLAYWTAIYIPPVVIEPLLFRRPVSRKTYNLDVWDQPRKLPIGLAAIASLVCGVPVIAAGMSQTWWTGWIARRVPGGYGDVAWEMTFVIVTIVYTGTRYLERKYTDPNSFDCQGAIPSSVTIMAMVDTAPSMPTPLGNPISNGIQRPSFRTRGSSSSSIPQSTPDPSPPTTALANLEALDRMSAVDPTPLSSLRRRHHPQPDAAEEDDTDHDTQSTVSQGSETPIPYHRGALSRSSSGFAVMRDRMKSPLIGSLKLNDLREHISKGVEVKWVSPYRLRSRTETAAVALWALLLPICLFFFFLAMSVPPLWVVLVPYLIWIQFDRAAEWGGRPKEWARRSFVWRYFADYYPCSIVKEADLPSDKTYVFGYHPHGIIGMGAFATFATNGTNFSGLFPGIRPHLLTLETNFKIPFYRDLMLAHGISSVSKMASKNILSLGPGNAITIVVGGAAESLSAFPGTADLTLKRRFGFIKIAIREGADLVPVFSFGENDIYDQFANTKGSTIYIVQRRFQKVFGFTLPLFYGRGIFNYNYGLMPFRHPIVSVVGRPIQVRQHNKPSDDMVQEIQQLYIEELMRIWNKYKDVYAANRTKELTLLD